MKHHTLNLLSMISKELRIEGHRIVHCHGVYDALTIGHAKHLAAAKRLGDVLIVTVTADEFVNKGEGRPVFTDEIRCQMLSSLAAVDYVAVNVHSTAIPAIKAIRPHLFVKGGEYITNLTAALDAEQEAVESVGGELVFTDEPEYHTTELIERLGVSHCR